MKAVGARLPRYDGIAHVTGRTQYVDDVRVHGTLWCKALRSPHHSALIRLDRHEQGAGASPACTRSSPTRTCPTTSTGTWRASASPPTSRCWPPTTCAGRASRSRPSPPMSEEVAQAAVDAIEVDVRGARADPRHPHRRRPRRGRALPPVGPDLSALRPAQPPPRAQGRRRGGLRRGRPHRRGRLPPAGDRARPLETQVSLVVPEPSGRLTIYSCTQAMYFSMGVVAAHLQWPLNKLKFVGGTVGGGFGGKVDTATETICALLAHPGAPPGQVALHPRGGVPDLLDARAVAHRDPRRGDQRRLDPRPAHADPARRRRLRALLALRADQARLPPHRRLHDPQPALRRLRALHQPRADDGHARLRRHVGVAGRRAAHEPRRRAARASTRSSCA